MSVPVPPCDGYACGPTHSVSVDDVIVRTADVLASTGAGAGWALLAGVVGLVMVVAGFVSWRRS